MNIDCSCVYFRKAECTHYKRPEKECWFLINGKCNPNRKTNADRIRAMSDEELLQVLGMFVDENLFDLICNNPKRTTVCDSNCVKCISEWLKQTAEVE